MLSETDAQWLHDRYPALNPLGRGVAGKIRFIASYDEVKNLFVILRGDTAIEAGAVALTADFQIRIEERIGGSSSSLPALYVDGIEPTPDRHFNQADKSACLCSPFHEDEFLRPELQFRLYLEQLVIPFLYGQVFYSSRKRWPWREYAHGATGILEAYSTICDQKRAADCAQILVQDQVWSEICSALRQKPYVKGHIPCFCEKKDQIRRCHPDALAGIRRLQEDLRAVGIAIPSSNRRKNVSINQRRHAR